MLCFVVAISGRGRGRRVCNSDIDVVLIVTAAIVEVVVEKVIII